jgi:hypothetical protein
MLQHQLGLCSCLATPPREHSYQQNKVSNLYKFFCGLVPNPEGVAMLTSARPFSGPSLPFCLPVIATRSIVLSIGAESSG